MTATGTSCSALGRTCDKLRIGYLVEGLDRDGARAMLVAARCQVIRLEIRSSDRRGRRLQAILRFLGQGDSLVVASLQSLGGAAAVLNTLQALNSRGALLEVLDPPFSSAGEGGRALAAGLSHIASMSARPVGSTTREIRALHEAGLGPSEIARRLGISRMTVWRKLRARST